VRSGCEDSIRLHMKRALPWIFAAIMTIAFIATFSELEKTRSKLGIATRPLLFHAHADVRREIISQQLARATDPIIVVGDSIVEAATLPVSLCGHPVVNAGIGGATVTDFKLAGISFLGKSRPSLVVIALGMNDALGQNASFVGDMRTFVAMVRTISPDILAFGITDTENGALVKDSTIMNRLIAAENADYADIMKTNEQLFAMPPPFHGHHTIDGVHLNGPAYDAWLAELVGAISGRLKCAKGSLN
jgi:lysophospholipase L1-like esterase